MVDNVFMVYLTEHTHAVYIDKLRTAIGRILLFVVETLTHEIIIQIHTKLKKSVRSLCL